MIDINLIRTNPQKVKQGAAAKKIIVDTEKILALDTAHRLLLQKIEELRAKKNTVGKEIATAAPEKKKALIAAMQDVDVEEEELKPQVTAAEEQLNRALMTIPNLPANDVRVGKDENENEELRTYGTRPSLSFEPKDSLTLGEMHDWIDMPRAAKVSGARFGYIKGDLALLEFALVRYAVETLTKEGFTAVIPPVLVQDAAMRGMGYLDHHGDQELYHFEKDDLYLVGTSEQSLAPMHMGEMLKAGELPKRYFAYTPCFRRESGSYGKDTRGMFRVHQFTKIEMVAFTDADHSDAEHERFLGIEERLMQALDLPHRVMRLCSGDTGAPSARTYDIETWLPSEERYRETSSTSNTTDFQARRLNIRYKEGSDKVRFVQILNGTFLSQRPLLMILENYQQADGSVRVPKVLQPYLGKEIIG